MRVYYKKEKTRFVMEDAQQGQANQPGQANRQVVEGRPPLIDPYRAPPESGKL
jgi:hypothetical protein